MNLTTVNNAMSVFNCFFQITWSFFVMDNLVKVTLRSQTIFSGFLFAFSVISWSTVIDQLRDHQGKDRLQFNCVPKQIEFKRQRCYDNYTSAMSPLLTPLDFAGITFGVSGCGWLFVTLMGVEMLRRIHKETNRRRQKTLKKQFLGVFIGHICLQFVLLVAMIVLFVRYQKLKYPAEYSCFSANTTLTSFNREAITITCNDLRYKEKSKLNIAIIVVFSVSILFCLLTIIQLAISKDELSKLLLGNIEEDHNEEENRPLQGELLTMLSTLVLNAASLTKEHLSVNYYFDRARDVLNCSCLYSYQVPFLFTSAAGPPASGIYFNCEGHIRWNESH